MASNFTYWLSLLFHPRECIMLECDTNTPSSIREGEPNMNCPKSSRKKEEKMGSQSRVSTAWLWHCHINNTSFHSYQSVGRSVCRLTVHPPTADQPPITYHTRLPVRLYLAERWRNQTSFDRVAFGTVFLLYHIGFLVRDVKSMRDFPSHWTTRK